MKTEIPKRQKRQSTKKVTLVSARSGASIVHGPHGQRFVIGVNHGIGGSEHISGGLVCMTPGMMAQPHIHYHSESVIVVIEGWAATLVGKELEPILHGPGDFIFIPEGVEHTGLNLSESERCVAIEFRTEKVFNEDVTILPGLFEQAKAVASNLRGRFSAGELPLPEGWQAVRSTPFAFSDPEPSHSTVALYQ